MTWGGESSQSGIMTFTNGDSPGNVVGNPDEVLVWSDDGKPEFVPPTSLSGIVTIGNLQQSTKSIFIWGNDRVGNSTTTRYLTPGFTDNLAELTPVRFILPAISGTFRNMIVNHNIPGGNGNDIVYTLRVNEIATPISVTMASTAASGSYLADSVNIYREDQIDIIVEKAINIGNSPNNIVVSLEFI